MSEGMQGMGWSSGWDWSWGLDSGWNSWNGKVGVCNRSTKGKGRTGKTWQWSQDAGYSSGYGYALNSEECASNKKREHSASMDATAGVRLLRDLPGASPQWESFIEDAERRSYSYVLRRECGTLASEDQLSAWFHALHPSSVGVGNGGWTAAYHRGDKLLRKTAWYVWPPCTCTYVYADTHQPPVCDPQMEKTIDAISQRVFEVCGVVDNPPDSVNLNFYPPGGGVGFHSDDEPLFDGLNREIAIISLSLSEPSSDRKLGSRWFEVRLKKGQRGKWGDVRAVELRRGDLMTMEGFFQLYYLHSAWPGDRLDVVEGPGRTAHGDRINLTWRWVVSHTCDCALKHCT